MKDNILGIEVDAEVLAKKYQDEEFHLSDDGYLSRYGWGKDILNVGMIVRVKKPDNNWRRGEIEYIKLEDGFPKIGVICGKNKLKFEKSWNEVKPDKTIENIIVWENLKVPERLKKMDTVRLLTEFRKRKRYLLTSEKGQYYRKELYLREHVGQTNEKTRKEIRRKKAQKGYGKRK